MVRLEEVRQSGQKDYLSTFHEIATSFGQENDLMTRNDKSIVNLSFNSNPWGSFGGYLRVHPQPTKNQY